MLLSHNVTVGIGIEEAWSARNTRFDIAWVIIPIRSFEISLHSLGDIQAAIDLGRQISEADAIALGSTNVEKLLGGQTDEFDVASMRDMVVTQGGGLLDVSSKVVAVISPRRAAVDLL